MDTNTLAKQERTICGDAELNYDIQRSQLNGLLASLEGKYAEESKGKLDEDRVAHAREFLHVITRAREAFGKLVGKKPVSFDELLMLERIGQTLHPGEDSVLREELRTFKPALEEAKVTWLEQEFSESLTHFWQNHAGTLQEMMKYDNECHSVRWSVYEPMKAVIEGKMRPRDYFFVIASDEAKPLALRSQSANPLITLEMVRAVLNESIETVEKKSNADPGLRRFVYKCSACTEDYANELMPYADLAFSCPSLKAKGMARA